MIYVLSDIHGNLRRLRSVLRQIRLQPEAAEKQPAEWIGSRIDPVGITAFRRIFYAKSTLKKAFFIV